MAKIVHPTLNARLVGMLVLAAGALVLLGWQFHLPALKGELRHGQALAPFTALCFILAGAGLWIGSYRQRLGRIVASLCGAVIAVISGAMLLEHTLALDLQIDTRFFGHRMAEWAIQELPPGRMDLFTSLALVFSGLSLLLAIARAQVRASQVLAGLCAAVAYVALLGRAYHVEPFFAHAMPIATIVLVLLLGWGLLVVEPGEALMGIVLSTSAGGFLARRLLVLTFLALPTLGFFGVYLQERGARNANLMTAMMVLAIVVTMAVSVVIVASALNAADDRREVAELALRRNEKLSAAGRFAATIAHEINNPLGAVMNLVYLLRQQSGLPTESRALLDTVDQELRRIAHISRQTLAFYKESTEREDFPVAELLDEVVYLLESKLRSKNLSVERDYEDCVILATKGEIRQVMSNLLSNAIDASELGGLIRLHVLREGRGAVRIEVEDHGPGIPEQNVRRLFQPFFTTKTDVGNGLGLWVSKNLVEKNGGEISARTVTEPGASGSTFIVLLPAAERRAVTKSA
jgi:signal transduction histidine kinase